MVLQDDLTDYVGKFAGVVYKAQLFLQQQNYRDPISRQPWYHVKTVLPGAPDVRLTYDGRFLLTQRSSRVGSTSVGSFVAHAKNDSRLIPTELLGFVVETVGEKGNTLPSRLPLEGVLEHLVHEMEVLPQVLALEMQGRLSETKELLRVN